MIKKILIVSFVFYIVSVVVPFRSGGIIKLNPISDNYIPKNSYSSNFEKTALKKSYTTNSKISFMKKGDLFKDAPTISARSAIVVDLKTNNVIYAKNENERLPFASLTKIMTAIIAVEHADTSKVFTVSKNAAEIGENTMGLKQNEKLTLKNLLYGLILNSANDAAVTIAEGVAGTENEFVSYMNKKALLLGANDTIFADASGLNKNKTKYFSTSEDLAKIAKYSLQHNILKEIYKTINYEIPATEFNSLKILENQTNLLTTYPGAKGMKTGYTEEAGLCLISYVENQGQELLVVILNSTDRKGDAIMLLDYGFSKLGINVEHNLL